MFRHNNCCRGKAIGITHSKCVSVASVMQHACAILSSVACLAVQYFPTLSHKRNDFRGKKIIEHEMCVLVFSTAFGWRISHSKKNSERCYLRVKRPSFCARFSWNSNFLDGFSRKNTAISKFHENPSNGSRFVPHGRTDLTKLTDVFRNFANAPKTAIIICIMYILCMYIYIYIYCAPSLLHSGYRVFTRGVNCGRGVLVTTHPLLVPRSWKSRAIILPTLWATPGL